MEKGGNRGYLRSFKRVWLFFLNTKRKIYQRVKKKKKTRIIFSNLNQNQIPETSQWPKKILKSVKRKESEEIDHLKTFLKEAG